MTRKRFVKLCMARGYSRNEANEMAREGVATYGSYSMLFTVTLMYSTDFHEAFCRAIQTAVDMAQEFCDGLVEVVDQVARSLQE